MADLITYRRWGGYAGLSQHMTVAEDGTVALRDRKTGKRTEVQASSAEIVQLQFLIDSIPAGRWHSLAGAIARRMMPRPHEAMRFQIHCSKGRIGGAAGSTEADLGPLLAELDELLARAVRSAREP